MTAIAASAAMTSLQASDPAVLDPGNVRFDDALIVARLFAVDPVGMGGIAVRAQAGPVRDSWLRCLRACLPKATRVVRVPLHVGEDRLLGGLDLTATLAAGRPVAERGLLATAHEGVLLLAMAERLSSSTTSSVTAAMDLGEVVAERDGLTLQHPAHFGAVALDEGIEADEVLPPSLADRLAFWIDLGDISSRTTAIAEAAALEAGADDVQDARARLPQVSVGDDVAEALASSAMALGILSLRAVLQALRAARAAAALAGRAAVEEADASLAARLVLAPRATQLPMAPEDTDESTEEPEPPPPNEQPPEPETKDEQDQKDDLLPDLDDIILAAVAAAIPPGLLDRLQLRDSARGPARAMGKVGQLQKAKRRGRPIGTRRGQPRGGNRLALVDTLRVAAPWQPLRHRERETANGSSAGRRIEVRPDDLRISRFKQRTETTVIFVVDASGSTAFNRLAEAKGAVELLLADCYVRRESVALIAFRGTSAELLLAPTRSLTRAKRSLAGLPGGGATPLAAGLDAAAELAAAVTRKGQTPILILLSDGRGNIALDGQPNRAAADADAQDAATRLRLAGVTTLFVDTSPRPQTKAQALAAAMEARYLAMPRADAATLSRAVKANTAGPSRSG